MSVQIPFDFNQTSYTQNDFDTKWIDVDLELDYVYLIVIPLISLFGFILNIIIIIIFSNKSFKEIMYKYLKMESIFICINLTIQMLRPVYFYKLSWFSRSQISLIYNEYLLNYMVSCLEMTAFILHILAIIDYYLLASNLNQKFKIFYKFSYIKISISIIIITMICFIFLCFEYSIEQKFVVEVNRTNHVINDKIIYIYKDTEFRKTVLFKIIELTVFSIRDGVLLIILIILNILIYFQVVKAIINKRNILKSNNQIPIKSAKVTVMVIFGCLNNIMGRTPILIDFILINAIGWNDTIAIVNKFACLAVYISYFFKFFLFLFFNQRFKKIVFNFSTSIFKLFK